MRICKASSRSPKQASQLWPGRKACPVLLWLQDASRCFKDLRGAFRAGSNAKRIARCIGWYLQVTETTAASHVIFASQILPINTASLFNQCQSQCPLLAAPQSFEARVCTSRRSMKSDSLNYACIVAPFAQTRTFSYALSPCCGKAHV